MSAPRLLVIGAGSQARYVLASVRLLGSHDVVGLIDTFENPALWGTSIDAVPVLGGEAALASQSPEGVQLILAVADPDRKEALANSAAARGFGFASVIHPHAIIASDVELGEGLIVNAGTIIERGTRVGSHVILHAGCVIEHDNVLGDFVNLGPGVVTAGRVAIERGATVFTGATLVPDVRVGARAVVGAGATVLRDVAPGTTVVGTPAREIRKG